MKSILKSTKRKILLSILTIIIFSGCSIDDFLTHQITQYIAVKREAGGYNVEKALRDGMTEEEILNYLAKTRNYRLDDALKAGVTRKEIIDYLSSQPKVGSEKKTEARGAKPEWKLHKIVYKVYLEKQDIIYWVEAKGSKEHSPLYKMRDCIIADSDNWQGERDYYSSFWAAPRRIEVVDRKLKFDGLKLPKVGWWKWNFDKESFQGSEIISTTWFVWNNNLVWIVLGVGILWVCLYRIVIWIEDKKRKR